MATKISQLKLPSPNDTDPHPRLLLDGYGIHAGHGYGVFHFRTSALAAR